MLHKYKFPQLTEAGFASRGIGQSDRRCRPQWRTERGAAEQTAYAAPVPPGPAAADALFGAVDGLTAGPAEVEGEDRGKACGAEDRCGRWEDGVGFADDGGLWGAAIAAGGGCGGLKLFGR